MARKHVEEFVLKLVKDLTGNADNLQRYKEFFKKLSDKELEEWVNDVADPDKSTKLYLELPKYSKEIPKLPKILSVGNKYDFEIFTKLINKTTGEVTANPVLVITMPVRRASQTVAVQIITAKDNNHIDMLTGQPSGPSASGKLTLPEEDILASLGYDKGLEELANVLGGDIGAYRSMIRSFNTTGNASLKQIEQNRTGVVAKKTLKYMLLVQGIETNM